MFLALPPAKRVTSHRNLLISSTSLPIVSSWACDFPAGPENLVYDKGMADGMFEVECPCCQAVLKIDPETRTVIAHTVPVKPLPIQDLAAEVAKLKGAGERHEETFQKNFAAEKAHGKVLEKKFDELFKRAKEDPDKRPPQRDMDLD